MAAALQSDTPPPGLMELPEVLDLKFAAPLAAEFLALRGRPLQVDGAQVQRLGGQCLQVLLSAAQSWKKDGVSFEFINLSGDFIEGLARLGVSAADFIQKDESQ
ncbi:MAG TPA: STAS domain-containing protein [Methylocella sp.]|nr:STAS domain-containing protein [Methylocella sp.]